MNAFASGIGKAFLIWPNTNYNALKPKVNPTIHGWRATGQALTNSMLKFNNNIASEELNAIQQESLAKARSSFASYISHNFDELTLDNDSCNLALGLLNNDQEALLSKLESDIEKLQQKLTLLKGRHE